ncbi:hypothetical protein [Burkholderia sp. MBR-1]|uniref:hypothetical protein n=1 Tax=Burkholderia sp. MBR-1 TaxID=2732364 RepID=UPI0015EEC986|nr:hypothetical protein [Burkholderia sp. MBR-1]QMI49699.1 hypothetical protein MBR110_29895 [Burkholderia sp. MBR-1]
MDLLQLIEFFREIHHLGFFCGLLIAATIFMPWFMMLHPMTGMESFGGLAALGMGVALDTASPSDDAVLLIGVLCAICALVFAVKVVVILASSDRLLREDLASSLAQVASSLPAGNDSTFRHPSRLGEPQLHQPPRARSIPVDNVDLPMKRRSLGMSRGRLHALMQRFARR